jgi:hypothetical protein
MAFIPRSELDKIEIRSVKYRLKEDCETMEGLFEKGTLMTLVRFSSNSSRTGVAILQDETGHELRLSLTTFPDLAEKVES